MKPGYETFEHGADIGIRGIGKTLEEAFINAAKALFSLMVLNLEDVRPEVKVSIEAYAETLEELFIEWLNKLLSEAGMENLVFSEFGCEIDQKKCTLKGFAAGERIDENRHELGEEVKGATFTMLKVEKVGELWVAQCVVDV
ncbi:archease [Thermodesulfatator atlanticus]|uniref:archease n=1 Tax=Thermodesulfatator atlanticus TaxID=501497 RepID=UPI0003B559F2|nr:archease [Thermodesulfatator atlanticus]